jgi:hypothetical protein
VTDYRAALAAVQCNPRYLGNLDWGEQRPGHPEGTIRAHIAEVQFNLDRLRSRLAEDDYWRLMLLVHTHDTFKAQATPGVPITDPRSHASLARTFLAGYVVDPDLLAMTQFHDEPYALWRQSRDRGVCDRERFETLLRNIRNWHAFVAFLLADGCNEGKGREPLLWLLAQLEGRVETGFTPADLL